MTPLTLPVDEFAFPFCFVVLVCVRDKCAGKQGTVENSVEASDDATVFTFFFYLLYFSLSLKLSV